MYHLLSEEDLSENWSGREEHKGLRHVLDGASTEAYYCNLVLGMLLGIGKLFL